MREKIKQLVKEIGISEIENALEELKSEKCPCDNHQRARDWFHNYLMGVSIHKNDKCPESLFFEDKNGQDIMKQDYKNDRLWVSYTKIWLVLQSEYDLKYKEVRDLIEDMVSKTFKIKVGTPFASIRIFESKGE